MIKSGRGRPGFEASYSPSRFHRAGSHEWLLGEEVDLLPALLLPLAGPEQFDDEEEEKLPVELQFLPDDKQREEDPVIRKMLIEALIKVSFVSHFMMPLLYVIPCSQCHGTGSCPDLGKNRGLGMSQDLGMKL